MIKKWLTFRGLLFFLSTSVGFVSCFNFPEELIAPQWQVDLNVPLVNRTYTLIDLLNEDPHIIVDTTGSNNIFIIQSGTHIANSGVAKFIQISVESSVQNIPVPASDTDSIVVYVAFPEGAEIDSAIFDDGFLSFSAGNPSPHPADLMIRVPGIFSPQGEELIFSLGVDPFESDSIGYDLSDHRYILPANQPSDKKNSLQIIIKADSPVPSETIVLTSFYISDFYFKSVSGLLPTKSLGDRIETIGLDMNETEIYRNNATLREAKLRLAATYFSPASNPVGVEIRNVNVIGKHNNGTEFYLRDVSGSINHTLLFQGLSSEKIFDENNSNIKEFISFLPDTLVLKSEYFLNPDQKRGTATNEDTIRFETEFSTKSFLALNSTSIGDRTAIEIGDKDRAFIRDAVYSDIILELENAIPLGLWYKMDLMDDQNNFLFTLTKDVGGVDSIYFEPADIDENGEVSAASVNQPIRIILDSAQIDMLSRTHSANFSVTISTANYTQNNPPTVAIRPSAWIKVKVFGSVRYRINN